MFFVGGGSTDAKPRAGYEVAVIQLIVDDIGLGSGTMAGAARVKPGGETGVVIDQYADQPIKLGSRVAAMFTCRTAAKPVSISPTKV